VDLVLSSTGTDSNLIALFSPKIRTLLDIVQASSVFMMRDNEFVTHGRDCLDKESATDLVKVCSCPGLLDSFLWYRPGLRQYRSKPAAQLLPISPARPRVSPNE
jgi:hypothetical protein